MKDMPQGHIAVPDGAVIITPDVQYRELQDLRRSVDRLTNVIDPALDEIRRDAAEAKKKVDEDHEPRIRALEKWRWQIAGALVLLGPGAGIAAGYLSGSQ